MPDPSHCNDTTPSQSAAKTVDPASPVRGDDVLSPTEHRAKLENERLEEEIRQLRNPWHTRTESWTKMTTAFVGVLGAFVAVGGWFLEARFSSARLELAQEKAQIKLEASELDRRKAQEEAKAALADASKAKEALAISSSRQALLDKQARYLAGLIKDQLKLSEQLHKQIQTAGKAAQEGDKDTLASSLEAASHNEQLRRASELAALRLATGKAIESPVISPKVIKSLIREGRVQSENIARFDQVPLLSADAIYRAMHKVAEEVPADSPAQDYVDAWLKQRDSFLKEQVNEIGNTDISIKLWKEFTDDWMQKVIESDPGRFRDALIQGAQIINEVLVEDELDSIEAVLKSLD